MKRAFTLISLALLFTISAQAKKIQVNDDAVAEVSAPKTAANGNSLRKLRRVGMGLTGAGPLGLGGVHLELNFSSTSGVLAGFGGGPGFQAYTFQYKRVLAGEWLLPYMSAGFSRWMNFGKDNDPITDTTPDILGERFMSDGDKASGRINEFLIYPAFGLQYVQLTGDWAGFSVFTEIVFLIDVADFVAAPTGTVGMTYFF